MTMFSQAGTPWIFAVVAVLGLLCILPARIRLPVSRAAQSLGGDRRGFASGWASLLCTAVESLWRRAERAPPIGQPA